MIRYVWNENDCGFFYEPRNNDKPFAQVVHGKVEVVTPIYYVAQIRRVGFEIVASQEFNNPGAAKDWVEKHPIILEASHKEDEEAQND